jgi:hypothetical protein
MNALLAAIVLGVMMLALIVNVAALVGWLHRHLKWR